MLILFPIHVCILLYVLEFVLVNNYRPLPYFLSKYPAATIGTNKPRYNEQVRQTLFVHFIE